MDYEEDNYEFKEDSEYTTGYREMEQRGPGGPDAMATIIEGSTVLARAQERMLQRSEGFAIDKRLLSYFGQLRDVYKRLSSGDQQIMFDQFHNLKNYEYKNPYAFLLAFIAVREDKKKLSKQTLSSLIKMARDLETPNISESDIIRYYRLLQVR